MSLNHPGIIKFKKDLKKKCKLHGIKLKLINKPSITFSATSNMQISGYFDSYNNELAVAIKKNTIEWLEILIHESCHLDQCIENCKVWKNNDHDGIDASTLIDLWLGKKIDLNKLQLNSMINLIIELERDCDIRAIKKMKHYKLQDIIDIPTYTQKSNSYHLSYVAVKKLRRWNKPMKSPYMIEHVFKYFSKNMSNKYTLTDKQFEVLKKNCY